MRTRVNILAGLVLSVICLAAATQSAAEILVPVNYVLSAGTSQYTDSTGKELNDNVCGETRYMDPAWVGWYNFGATGEDVVITFDFGAARKFTRFSLVSLNQPEAGINPIEKIAVSFSEDNRVFSTPTVFLTTKDEQASGPGGRVVNLARQMAGRGQWVKFVIRQKNPSTDHPWVFISEVDFEGSSAK